MFLGNKKKKKSHKWLIQSRGKTLCYPNSWGSQNESGNAFVLTYKMNPLNICS